MKRKFSFIILPCCIKKDDTINTITLDCSQALFQQTLRLFL